MEEACEYWRMEGCPYSGLFLQGDHHCPWTLAAEMPLRSCGAAVVRSCGHLCSSVPEPMGNSVEGLGPGSSHHGNSASGKDVPGVRGMSHLPQQPSNQQKKPVIGPTTTGSFVIGCRGLTRVPSLVLGLPSVGPTCTRWLKLVGGEMNFERTKGSFSISLEAEGV